MIEPVFHLLNRSRKKHLPFIGLARRNFLHDLSLLRDKRGYFNAGIPRFNYLFGRDSIISAWQTLDYNPSVARATLAVLSKLQGKKNDLATEEEPGKIIHEAYFGPQSKVPHTYFRMPYYGSADATPLYLLLFMRYLEKTNDAGFLKKHIKNIRQAQDFMLKKIHAKNKDDFFRYRRTSRGGDFHQGWKDGRRDHLRILPPVAIVEVQGYVYAALRETAHLAGSEERTLELVREAEHLKTRFLKKFWLKKEKYFVLALDGRGKKRKAVTSNPGHLLFTGILDKVHADLVVKRLFKSDLFTPYGIRTHSKLEKDFNPFSYHLGSVWPHDNWVIAEGLKKTRHWKEYNRVVNGLKRAYRRMKKIPEYYAVVGKTVVEIPGACYPHAWSSGALLNMLSMK